MAAGQKKPKGKPKKLSEKQELFCREYVASGCNGAAAIRRMLGDRPELFEDDGTKASNYAYEAKKNPEVQARIKQLLGYRFRNADIRADKLFKRLAGIALTDLGDIATWDGEGIMFFPDFVLPRHAVGAIQALECDEVTTTDKDGNTVTTRNLKAKMHCPMRAAKMILDMGKEFGQLKQDDRLPSEITAIPVDVSAAKEVKATIGGEDDV